MDLSLQFLTYKLLLFLILKQFIFHLLKFIYFINFNLLYNYLFSNSFNISPEIKISDGCKMFIIFRLKIL